MLESKLNIQVIDDDRVYQFMAKKIIDGSGLAHSLHIYSNAVEALNYLKINTKEKSLLPDIIFLDVNMPGMSGWEFLNAFNNIKGALVKKPIIYLVSSSADEVDTRRSREYDAVSGYVIKPIVREKFQQLIASVSARKITDLEAC